MIPDKIKSGAGKAWNVLSAASLPDIAEFIITRGYKQITPKMIEEIVIPTLVLIAGKDQIADPKLRGEYFEGNGGITVEVKGNAHHLNYLDAHYDHLEKNMFDFFEKIT